MEDEWRERTSRAVLRGFEKMGMDVHIMSNILGDYQGNPPRYHVKPPHDMHPTPYAHGVVAEYVVEHILGE